MLPSLSKVYRAHVRLLDAECVCDLLLGQRAAEPEDDSNVHLAELCGMKRRMRRLVEELQVIWSDTASVLALMVPSLPRPWTTDEKMVSESVASIPSECSVSAAVVETPRPVPAQIGLVDKSPEPRLLVDALRSLRAWGEVAVTKGSAVASSAQTAGMSGAVTLRA